MDRLYKYSSESFLGITFLKQNSRELFLEINHFEDYLGQHIHLISASTLVAAHKSDILRSKLNSGINICDSTPIYLLSRLHKKNLLRCRGADFMRKVFDSDLGEKSHFLFGSTTETLIKLEKALMELNDQVKIVGKLSPPFSPTFEVTAENLDCIHISKADNVWIGLGSPKQDAVAFEISKELGVNTFAVGAAFDFVSGNKKESPLWLRNSGFEWLFRLTLEPRRLWRRYIFDNLTFVIIYFKYLYRMEK